jgi:hypothetical protein
MVLDNDIFSAYYIGSINLIVNNEFYRIWKETGLAYVQFEILSSGDYGEYF